MDLAKCSRCHGAGTGCFRETGMKKGECPSCAGEGQVLVFSPVVSSTMESYRRTSRQTAETAKP